MTKTPKQSKSKRASSTATDRGDWNFEWFVPSFRQQFIVDGISENEMVVVQGSSGTGKTTTAIWKGLKEYALGRYDRLIMIRTPAESGDDQIGYLKGDQDDKLAPHREAMKHVLLNFMSRGKLDCDIKNENIILDIPNYLQGKTFDNALIILDEAQNMSPSTIKLCCERVGKNSRLCIIGDSRQSYAIKRRPDGLKDLIKRLTYDYDGVRLIKPDYRDRVTFVEMFAEDNLRSDLSRFIVELYEED